MTTPVWASDGSSYSYDGYIYDCFGNTLESPAAFRLETVIDASCFSGMAVQGMDDVCTSKDGRIFLTDTLSGRVNVCDRKGTLLKSIKTIWNKEGTIQLDENGNQIVLNTPEGTYVHEKSNELYITDSAAQRIVVLNLDDYTYNRVIARPENMTGATEFKPSKIAVDNANRIFVVVQSSYEGIIELAPDGSFIGYYGVNKPLVNFVEYFWKSLATDDQKQQMSKTLAPAFNNIAVDGEGFVMAVSYDNAADFVFRLNSKGENVLREEGNFPVVGDLHTETNDYSKFTDIAVTDYGTYAVVDKQRGRIFLYNFDGEMLNAFGSLGNLKGELKNPTGIAWLGDSLVVTDKTLKCAYVLQPTEFGSAMLRASDEYYNGNWDQALGYFEEAVRLNANYEVAYSGIGKNYLMKDEYKSAMYYFELGNNREYYSKAFYGYRGEQLRDNFALIGIVAVVLLGAVIFSEIRYYRKGKKPE